MLKLSCIGSGSLANVDDRIEIDMDEPNSCVPVHVFIMFIVQMCDQLRYSKECILSVASVNYRYQYVVSRPKISDFGLCIENTK